MKEIMFGRIFLDSILKGANFDFFKGEGASAFRSAWSFRFLRGRN